MENEIKNVSTGNKNLVMIIAFVVLGIIIGYFLGNSKLNTQNQGAQTISSDVKEDYSKRENGGIVILQDIWGESAEKTSTCPMGCEDGQICVNNMCIWPTTPMRTTSVDIKDPSVDLIYGYECEGGIDLYSTIDLGGPAITAGGLSCQFAGAY